MNDLLGRGGGAEAAGKGAGGARAEPQQAQQVAVRLMGGTAKVPHPSRAVPGQAEGPAFIEYSLPLCTKQNLLGLEHPCSTSAPLSAMVTHPQDNLAHAMETTRSML